MERFQVRPDYVREWVNHQEGFFYYPSSHQKEIWVSSENVAFVADEEMNILVTCYPWISLNLSMDQKEAVLKEYESVIFCFLSK